MTNEKPLVDTAMQLAVIAKEIESISDRVNQQSQQNMAAMQHFSQQLMQQIKQFLEEANEDWQQRVGKAIQAGMDEGMTGIEKRIKNVCDRVDHTTDGMHRASESVKRQTRHVSWLTLTGVTLACVALISFTLWYSWNKKTSIEELSRRYDQLEQSVQIREAMNKLQMTWCDGKACIRLNRDAPRYEKNREYVLIEE